MSNTPSDAELDALRQADNGELNFVTLRQFRIIARAALAKWGQPAHSGEPVATVIKRGASRDWMSERLGGLPDGVYSLYLAPPPVEREPLTDEEVDSLCKVGFVYVIDGKVTRTPTQYRDELKAAQRYGLRKGERAHGIKKGGHHGTDT